MSRGQYRDRGQRRRGFDDDNFSSQDARDARPNQPPYLAPPRQEATPAQGEVLDATVKMFNTEKGFGFVELSDGSGDAFLHIATLQAAGHDAPAPGTKMRVLAGRGQKGPQVTAVLDVDNSMASAARVKDIHTNRALRQPDPSTAIEMHGAVKWFSADKGFGFVQIDDGGKDVFLHAKVVERAGLSTLAEGTPVSIRVVEVEKGREAISVTIVS
jgi:CspA family cold shock protein